MVKGKASSYMGGGYKRAFDLQRFAQVDNPYEFDIDNNKLVDIDTQRTLADLSSYARNNIVSYRTITTIPQENIEYLSSGLAASNCRSMFYNCRQLTSIPWNEFNIDTSQVTDIRYMFQDCSALTSLDLSNFNTSKVTSMYQMFRNCNSLQEIICPNGFDMSSCTDVDSMFTSCNSYNGEPLHFKNVPRNLSFTNIEGIEGTHYVIDNYKD